MTPDEIRELVSESEKYHGPPPPAGWCPECKLECTPIEDGFRCLGCKAEMGGDDLLTDDPEEDTFEVGDAVVPIGDIGAGYVRNITRGQVVVEFDHQHSVKYATNELRKVAGRDG